MKHVHVVIAILVAMQVSLLFMALHENAKNRAKHEAAASRVAQLEAALAAYHYADFLKLPVATAEDVQAMQWNRSE